MFFFIAFAAGALFAAILAFLEYSLFAQCMSGLFVSVVTFVALKFYIEKQELSQSDRAAIQTNSDALIGKKAVVVASIHPNNLGRIKVDGEEWPAKYNGQYEIKIGSTVLIKKISGNKVIVEPLNVEN